MLPEAQQRGAQLPDELSARIPLAYVHLTSLLVDALLTLSPLALLPRTGAFTVVLCPLIVRSYPYRFNINTQLHPLHSLRSIHSLHYSCSLSLSFVIVIEVQERP